MNPNEKRLIIKTVARKKGEQWRGLGLVIGNGIYKRAKQDDYQSVIHAFMKKEGFSESSSHFFSGKMMKEYALYGKAVV